MKSIYFIILFFSIHPILYAQFEITGTISSDSIKLESVNIAVLNSNRGTITNSKGQFKLNNVSTTDTIRFSMMGYQTLDTLFYKGVGDAKIKLKQSIIEISEIEITTPNYVSDILKNVLVNLENNYPVNSSIINAIFRKQIVQNGDYLFLGNSQISIFCPSYLSNEKKNVYLNTIKLTKNELVNINMDIPPSSLLDFSPKFGFITSPEYFDFTFLKSIKWNNAVFLKIAFKTKQKYWDDSPFEGVLTIEKSSYAISEIEWTTHKKDETKKGYNREMGIYKGTFVTNQLKNHISYTKKNDNKWHFSYNRIIWDVTIKYKKYPDENQNLILKSDLYVQENDLLSSIKNLESININVDLFNKQKSLNYSEWDDLNPILPDFK
ncbi:carboxypeptidase-like regulatory domain-containing protein [Formosa sediminum]|uniref:Carboxypeptidase-like regulatory domain-containing protein n=1 Tax=Formosa sediminum TaxID=2594004 RepID=A0A516GRR6_9FLAO|nr:carboxypeptidase-like regulatory domain-containing protein [Formosa sediminum]QDO94209.1 carboxypeptidase-like regulatory domain-containing protein [Formosa sediminum]